MEREASPRNLTRTLETFWEGGIRSVMHKRMIRLSTSGAVFPLIGAVEPFPRVDKFNACVLKRLVLSVYWSPRPTECQWKLLALARL